MAQTTARSAVFPDALSGDHMLRYIKDIAVGNPCDVIVCGGGPAGIAAAIAARRAGMKVLLVEATGQLGGMGTSGLVSHWLGGWTSDGRLQCVGGIFTEFVQETSARGIAVDPTTIADERYPPFGWLRGLATGVPFDPFAMAAYLDEKVLAEGVHLLLLTHAVDVLGDEDHISHVIVFNKGGFVAIPARVVIDATGDADVAFYSGCETVAGRPEDRLLAPASLEFHVDNVDQDALASYIYEYDSPRLRELIADLRARGEWPFPYDIFISVQLTEKGTMFINTNRLVGVDGTDGLSLTQGMISGRHEIMELMRIMRNHIPGFAHARLKTVASLMGIRETRRIVGDFVLTVNDLLTGRDFEDTIGFSGYGWDLPDPKKPSHQPMVGKPMARPYTPIPYRCLVPRPITNVLCPGRAISVERDCLGPLRVQAPCMAMGEAAGLAAAMIVSQGTACKDLDVTALREQLRKSGAIVDME